MTECNGGRNIAEERSFELRGGDMRVGSPLDDWLRRGSSREEGKDNEQADKVGQIISLVPLIDWLAAHYPIRS